MLEKIQKPNDIKKIPADQLPALAEEIREFIIESLSKTCLLYTSPSPRD